MLRFGRFDKDADEPERMPNGLDVTTAGRSGSGQSGAGNDLRAHTPGAKLMGYCTARAWRWPKPSSRLRLGKVLTAPVTAR